MIKRTRSKKKKPRIAMGGSAIAELSREYEIHPNQIYYGKNFIKKWLRQNTTTNYFLLS